MMPKIWNSNLLLGTVAVFGAVSAGYATRSYLGERWQELAVANERRFQMKPVVVAQRDLVAGHRLEQDMLALRPMPTDFLPAGVLSSARAGDVIGRVLAHDLRKGEPLQSMALASKDEASLDTLLPAGYRALTVAVDELGSQSGLVQAGDNLDIYLVRESGKHSRSDLLLEQVLVLATGSRTLDASSRQGQPGDFGTVTLLVQAEQAVRIILAGKEGSLSFLLRSKGDTTPVTLRQLDSAHLFAQGRGAGIPPATQDRVELLLGGQGGPSPGRIWLQTANNALSVGGG